MRVWTLVVLFRAHLAYVAHTVRAVFLTEAASFAVVTLWAFRIPKQTKLFTILAHLLRAPATADGNWFFAICTIALEFVGALAPAVVVDALKTLLANRVAQVVSLLQSRTTLVDYLADITEMRLQPARLA